MGLAGLLNVLRDVDSYERVLELSGSDPGPIVVVSEAAKSLLLAALAKDFAKPMVIICPHPEDARRLIDELEIYDEAHTALFHFPEAEVLPYERLSMESGTAYERIQVLGSLQWPERIQPLIVTSITALLQKTISPSLLRENSRVIHRDERLAVEATLEHWAKIGYQIDALVDHAGMASRRGGILDVFGPGNGHPVRLDLWGDVVDSIRVFDPHTQRSAAHLETVRVLPTAEFLPTLADHELVNHLIGELDYTKTRASEQDRVQDELANLLAGLSSDNAAMYAGFILQHTLLDHLPDDTIIVLNEQAEIDHAAHQIHERSAKMRLAKEARGELPLGFPSGLAEWTIVQGRIEGFSAILELTRYQRSHATKRVISLPFDAAPSYHGAIHELANAVRDESGKSVVIATQHSNRLKELLAEADVGATEQRSLDQPPPPGVTVVHATVPGGWSVPLSRGGITLLSDAEVFGAHKQRVRKPKRHSQRFTATTVEELTAGEHVVHIDHGIGKFVGTIRKADESLSDPLQGREYLVLEYAEGDRLYVPMEHLSRLSPYAGGEEDSTTLTRLGTQEWTRAVARARESTKRLAFDLLALYAQRESAQGFAHDEDTPWQHEMEDAFPYEETPDQRVTINDVKWDMEDRKPMDRLVCGDVGYGKTEVAMRAAFKAVMSGKQVAVLVPTTVLAQQHYQSFAERMAPFPTKVDVLSRFRTPKEQEEVVSRLRTGDIDVVIGTHRLVQKDVSFKDLGMVIIDEEHRFGVGHKEQLKQLREEVDILALTATPIPRTLHMAMSGVRDISTIETPPEERLPIKTYLAERSEDLIKEAVQRELDRGGQVFFVHNRVKSIRLVADQVRNLVPESSVLIAHGQMPEEQLAEVMSRFEEGEADVLVCTTIIEAGLDIPRANTLIIDSADHFGLAQLYQLRGRIGRGAQRAYAYLMVERGRRLTDTAKRRLETILAATELGAGFRIAMKDLEIRGAGNILGPEQSGHIHAVGFDLYTRLLAEAVSEIRGTDAEPQPNADSPDPLIDLGITAAIPDELVPHMPTRMAMYQRLAKARSLEEVDDLPKEFMDRFGKRLPDELHNLIYTVRIRVLAREARIESVIRRQDHLTLKLLDDTGGARVALERALGHGSKVGHQQVHIPLLGLDATWGEALIAILENLRAFRESTIALTELEG